MIKMANQNHIDQQRELRKRIRESIQKFKEPTVEDVVSDVSRFKEIDEADVVEMLETFEQHGFIYLVPKDDGSKEVRLT